MKHKITIEKIQEKDVIKNVWIEGDDHTKDGYADKVFKQDVEETIYEQTIEGKIDLMAVIKAFNSEDVPGEN